MASKNQTLDHEKERITQFRSESYGDEQKFEQKILRRAEKCSPEKLQRFAQALKEMGYGGILQIPSTPEKAALTFQTLFKQATSGAIQQWTVSAAENEITSTWGQVGGKLQETTDVIREGKNLGRSNATTPETQAQAQAQQLYDAKLKEGYVTDVELARSTKNTLEAIEPMLAYPIEKKEKYVVFPALAQPKLDGARCLAIMKKGKVRLFSRSQKEWITMPHIVSEIEKLYGSMGDIVLDGELYTDKLSRDFNKIMSIIKRDSLHPEHKSVQYHVYDVVGPSSYLNRTSILDKIQQAGVYCKRVNTVNIASREALEAFQVKCVEDGYEGAIYRNPKGNYENKRSTNLLKVKSFQDAEFEVVDLEEGAGKLMNHVGAFVCKLPNGGTVKASPLGSHELLAEYWKTRKSLVGKQVTIKFQGYTPDGSLRFPKVKCVRDYE